MHIFPYNYFLRYVDIHYHLRLQGVSSCEMTRHRHPEACGTFTLLAERLH